MSVINNVLKDLETRESRFTPIEIESIGPLRARVFEPKQWLLGGVMLLVLALAAWYYLRPVPVPQTAAAAPAPITAPAVQAPVPAPASVVDTPQANQIIGLHIRESEREMRLEFALRERVVAFLQERGENSFAYRLRDIESEIAAPSLRDNRFLDALEIVAHDDGVDILFQTVPDILVETRQNGAGEQVNWVIDLRQAAPVTLAAREAPAQDADSVALAQSTLTPPATPPGAPVTEAPLAVATEPAPVVEAAPAAEVRLEIKSTNPNAESANQLDYAVTLMGSRRYGDAETALQKLLDGSEDYQARRHLLALYGHRQQAARLLQLARESSARYPDDAGFRGEYGRALLQQGRYPAVIDLISGRDDLDAGQHALLAVAHQRLDQHAEAIRYYELALAQEPKDARNWIGLGISQEHSSALEDALRSYRLATRLGGLTPRLQAFVARRSDTLQQVLN